MTAPTAPSRLPRACTTCGQGPRRCDYHGPKGPECGGCHRRRLGIARERWPACRPRRCARCAKVRPNTYSRAPEGRICGTCYKRARYRGLRCASCGEGPKYCPVRTAKGPECRACYQARRGRSVRFYRGPCQAGDCGRPARSISGFCHLCYGAIWKRTRAFKALTGTELSLATVAEALKAMTPRSLPVGVVQQEAVRAAIQLVRLVADGRVSIHRQGGKRATGFVGWRLPAAVNGGR